MTATNQEISIKEEAVKLFVFDEVYSFRAAQAQAEKKKLNAFGMMAKLNFLNRPKDDTVHLTRKESRYEPFWLIEAVKSIDYSSQIIYQVPMNNPFVQSVGINGVDYEVSHQRDRARIDIAAQEFCHRKIVLNEYWDGLDRDVKRGHFEHLMQKYRFSEMKSFENDTVLKPLLTQQIAVQRACSTLNGEKINAHEILHDEIVFEKIHLFFVPVFAFEFIWSAGDKVGVIEVNGLTGEVTEDGQWYKEKLGGLITRDMLVELGADIASELVPGAGIAVRVAGKITEQSKK
ncbi:hypothetical protein B0181_03035 [Moraxella caviae]|uniref:Uncharacterized protein n=1 Tax=Moraxella caviae TaxID=34060 RepID=A0A1T0A732_9GAMM|nr:hypothetical protein [Moraxella caviae]OOR91544.1 hypothetical protein B0181_03035 [Moraxella caviae]STZ14371.1 Uncharacterised protein [Moraxella caviae]VEW12816.1 Uncharacterised protein [Moraxella caviae]